jgi:hypothetical protein
LLTVNMAAKRPSASGNLGLGYGEQARAILPEAVSVPVTSTFGLPPGSLVSDNAPRAVKHNPHLFCRNLENKEPSGPRIVGSARPGTPVAYRVHLFWWNLRASIQ